jgi:hypothetical protein
MTEGHAFKYEFKMFMEGIVIPFQSAMISCTPNGVEMNIVVHPTTTVFELKPKTFVQVFYKDWTGPVEFRSFHLLGDGYFSAYSKLDSAQGQRSVSLVCRDFRMDIRKTPAALIYQPDTTDTMNQNLLQMPAFGVASGQAINLESTEMTSVGRKPTLRTWGGSLNNFYYIMNTIAGSATGNPSASFTGIKDPSTGKPMHDGRFMLDAILRGLWVESVCGTTYGAFVNSRIRADKRFFVPENRAGYTFFNQQYLDSFGGASIMGSSAFSSVEAVMMRVAAIFQAFPACCSTPTLIDAADAMAIPVHDFIVLKNPKYFGAPFVLNQTMVLPPLNFTAPPNCNILFPCMYNTVQWMHDYDSDPTRGMYKQQNVFGNSLGDTVFARYIMVPNSLLDGRKDSRSHPPITLDERYRGVGMEFGTVEYLVAARNATYAVAEAIIKDPKKKAALNKIIKKLGLKDLGTINDYYDKL